MKWRGYQHWKRYWILNILQFLFPRSINEIVQDELTEALHPEFGWVWREDEQGGKLISQARAQGWRDCFDQVLSGKGREKE